MLTDALAPEGFVSALSGSSSGTTQFALNGLALIVVAIVAPEGITGVIRRWSQRVADSRWRMPLLSKHS